MSKESLDRLSAWFDWAIRLAIVATTTTMIGMMVKLSATTEIVSEHATQIATMQSDIKAVRSEMVSKVELIEMFKRIELQMELMVERSSNTRKGKNDAAG